MPVAVNDFIYWWGLYSVTEVTLSALNMPFCPSFCVKHYKKMSDSDTRHLRQWTILMVGLVLCYRGNIQAPVAVDDFNGGVGIVLQR